MILIDRRRRERQRLLRAGYDRSAIELAVTLKENHGPGGAREVERWLTNPMLTPPERRRIEVAQEIWARLVAPRPWWRFW